MKTVKLYKRIMISVLLLLLVSCSITVNKENKETENEPNNTEEITEVVQNDGVDYPLIYNDEQISKWITQYKGRWVYENGDVFLDLQIIETQKDDPRYCILGANLLDGYFFSIVGIEQQNKNTYILSIEGLETNWNNIYYPTNKYLIIDEDINDDLFKLQFVGVYKSTLESFAWNDELHYDSDPLELLKLSDEYYLSEDEWYTFTKNDF